MHAFVLIEQVNKYSNLIDNIPRMTHSWKVWFLFKGWLPEECLRPPAPPITFRAVCLSLGENWQHWQAHECWHMILYFLLISCCCTKVNESNRGLLSGYQLLRDNKSSAAVAFFEQCADKRGHYCISTSKTGPWLCASSTEQHDNYWSLCPADITATNNGWKRFKTSARQI